MSDFAIELKSITKYYPGAVALNNVDLKVKKGTIHGFLGPNGAGKSTTMKIIAGLIIPNAGDVSVNGNLGFLPDIPPLYHHMHVKEFLEFVYDIQTLNDKNSATKKNQAIQAVLLKTGLVEVKDREIVKLSKGYQQRVGIAEALVHSPEVIILDEPTVGLDPVAIDEIRALIKELKKEHTILFSSHLLHEVEQLCDEITIISKGEILVSGEINKIKERFQGVHQARAVVREFNEADINELKQRAQVEDVKLNKMGSMFELKCYSSFDAREKIGEYLVSKGCGLLELHAENTQLEDVFKRMLQNKAN